MNVNQWGPAAWKFLHAASFAVDEYPTKTDQKRISKFFETLPYMLPCKICRQHFLDFAQDQPIDTSSRKTITQWIVNLHNNVNKLNKKRIVTYEEVENKFSYSTTKTYPNNTKVKIGLTIVVSVVVVIIFILCIALLVYSCSKGRCPLV